MSRVGLGEAAWKGGHLVAICERSGAVILVEGKLALQPLRLLPLDAPLLVHGARGGPVMDEVLSQTVTLRH